MPKDDDRIIYQRNNGDWVNKKIVNKQATSLHSTQKEAYNSAKINHQHNNGGEISIKRGDNGRIRAKHTINPANDPRNILG